MEDQQPAAGGLTDEAAEAPAAADGAETAEAPASAEAVESDCEVTLDAERDSESTLGDGHDTADGDDAGDDGDAGGARGAKKKKSGRLAAVVVAVVAALFVGSAAFAAAMVQPYLAERATVDVKYQVARSAVNAITTLWSYTPENVDSLADRAGRYLTGDFGAQYRKFVEPIVAPSKQAKITNSTEVSGVAVESLDGPNAVAIVYTNTTTTSPLKKNIPTFQYLSYRLTMKRTGGNWLVTRMTTITSLDVTPHI